MTAEIIELDEQRERCCHIALARASDDWQQIKATFAIEGMMLDDSNAEIIGCMLAGKMTLGEAQKLILRRFRTQNPIQFCAQPNHTTFQSSIEAKKSRKLWNDINCC